MENDQPPSLPDATLLHSRYEELQRLFLYLLLVLCILAGTLCFFLSRQAKNSASDLALYRTQTTNLVAQLKPNEPMMDDLLKKFQEFGRTNPDFVPYLAKYGISPNIPIGTVSTNRATAPVTKKK